MRRFLLTAVITLATTGAALAATPSASRTSPERISRAQADITQACRSDCLQQAVRPGAHPSAAQACMVRCGAGQDFARQEGRSQAVVSGRGIQRVSMPQSAPAMTGVIFAARSPSPSFGMVVAGSDRMSAFRIAEQRCTAGGPGCRVIAEFSTACGAVAQGLRRHPSAFVMTNDPSTYLATSTNPGTGATRDAAEAEAMAECRSRDPQSQCRVMAAQCGRG